MGVKLAVTALTDGISSPISQLMQLYQNLGVENMDLLDEVYANDVVFIDPLHRIEGLADLKRYFANMYQNIGSIDFVFQQVQDNGEEALLVWTMTFTHPRLAGGRAIVVEGVSQIRYRDSVYYHRDFFDAGAMLYEHLPGLGSLIRLVKRRAGL